MKEPAPDVFKVKLETTKGDVLVEVHKEWAPLGAQRFYDLVKAGFYNDTRLFRMVTGFVVQWGINGDPAVNEKWDVKLKDEPVKQSNLKGYLSFAAGGPNTRTTQMFINLGDNTQLDTYTPGFAPFGKVVEGMEVVEHFNSKYDEQPTQTQSQMRTMGNAFTDKRFPGLDSIKSASIVP
ncbi:MAG: peptidylprolyl isomerase [Candidatus Hydrogenedentes bacterium]|nr:peptidylprolyl isomerase [Candidatus Hydrogenedentota bacterium]